MLRDVMTGLWIPFVGTVLGSAMVFFMKKQMNCRMEKLLPGFAAGVMVAASVWSLLIPSIDMAEEGGWVPWFPASAGFLLGLGFLLLLDRVVPQMNADGGKPEGQSPAGGRSNMLVFAVTLHNIPEGMAVGVAFAGAMVSGTRAALAGAFALAVGIGIQNFPEGAIISMPLCSEGMGRRKAFFYGMLSGLVEPLSGLFTVLLTGMAVAVLPFLLSFAAGAMIYVVVEELIPISHTGEHGSTGTVGVAAGFVMMMILDVALG